MYRRLFFFEINIYISVYTSVFILFPIWIISLLYILHIKFPYSLLKLKLYENDTILRCSVSITTKILKWMALNSLYWLSISLQPKNIGNIWISTILKYILNISNVRLLILRDATYKVIHENKLFVFPLFLRYLQVAIFLNYEIVMVKIDVFWEGLIRGFLLCIVFTKWSIH